MVVRHRLIPGMYYTAVAEKDNTRNPQAAARVKTTVLGKRLDLRTRNMVLA
jgi:hypothetical protein